MATYVRHSTGAFTLTAYRGDRKTLLAFNLSDTERLAGFTIQCKPPGLPAYYLYNSLQFEKPAVHAQDKTEPAYSTINAPIHKFRWVHVPGTGHQGTAPVYGDYTYIVTPRYFDEDGHLLPLDAARSAKVTIAVDRIEKGALSIGFTRGYMQSQGFVHNFGKTVKIKPATDDLIFDTSAKAGTDPNGKDFTYADMYGWMGFTAREQIFEILSEVETDKTFTLDMFAYDLNEPDVLKALKAIAGDGRLRLILDDADLHHNVQKPEPEDKAEALLNSVKPGTVMRGHFGRYAHDKVLIVYRDGAAIRATAGSTNFSVTGFYVNSNHFLDFKDAGIAKWYAAVFDASWKSEAKLPAFVASTFSNTVFATANSATPKIDITFSPHNGPFAQDRLGDLVKRVQAEDKMDGKGSVFFAVMELDGKRADDPNSHNIVYKTLNRLHLDQAVYSCGISDNPEGVYLHSVAKAAGVLVTGKPGATLLPPPFDQIASIGLGHQIHHKFVVCGFDRPDAVVYCSSSNLAEGGEKLNSDNLVAIHDSDIATAFVIEALLLVDHFDFLDRFTKADSTAKPQADRQAAAKSVKWFLGTTDAWAHKYFDPEDLHCRDRLLFG